MERQKIKTIRERMVERIENAESIADECEKIDKLNKIFLEFVSVVRKEMIHLHTSSLIGKRDKTEFGVVPYEDLEGILEKFKSVRMDFGFGYKDLFKGKQHETSPENEAARHFPVLLDWMLDCGISPNKAMVPILVLRNENDLLKKIVGSGLDLSGDVDGQTLREWMSYVEKNILKDSPVHDHRGGGISKERMSETLEILSRLVPKEQARSSLKP